MDTEDFLSSLLDKEEKTNAFCPSQSPLGSDSGISDDSSTGAGNNNLTGCLSPHGSDSDIVPSPTYSQPSPLHFESTLVCEEQQTENLEALTVRADHSYSLLQSGDMDMDVLQSVRAEKPDTDVFIDLGIDFIKWTNLNIQKYTFIQILFLFFKWQTIWWVTQWRRTSSVSCPVLWL